jgi:hypothetical protein
MFGYNKRLEHMARGSLVVLVLSIVTGCGASASRPSASPLRGEFVSAASAMCVRAQAQRSALYSQRLMFLRDLASTSASQARVGVAGVAATYSREGEAALTLTRGLAGLTAPVAEAAMIRIWLAERREAALALGNAAHEVATGRFSGGLIGQSDLAAEASQRSALALGIPACALFPTGAVATPGMLSGLKVAYLTKANAICLGFELRGLSPSVNAYVGAIHHIETGAKPRQAARRAHLTREADAIERVFVSGESTDIVDKLAALAAPPADRTALAKELSQWRSILNGDRILFAAHANISQNSPLWTRVGANLQRLRSAAYAFASSYGLHCAVS